MLTLASLRDGRNIAEIGTAHGDTTLALARVCSGSRVFTFDVCRELIGATDSPFDHEIMVRGRVGAAIAKAEPQTQSRITSVVAHPSTLRAEFVEHHPYGLVFVDGDHTWRNVIEDTKVAVNCLEDDGILVWDDYTTCNEVRSAVDVVNLRCRDKITHLLDTRLCYVHMDAEKRTAFRAALADL